MWNARCLAGIRQDVGPCHGAAERKEPKVRSLSITQQMSHISPLQDKDQLLASLTHAR